MKWVRGAEGADDTKESSEPRQHRRDLILFRVLPEQALQLTELLGVLGGDVGGLREVVVKIVEFPPVLIWIPLSRGEFGERLGIKLPRNPVQAGARHPAVLVHGTVAEHLEILLRVPFLRARVGERVAKARPVHRHLGDAVNLARLGNASRLQDGRGDIDDVRELAAQAALVLDRGGPGDNHRVPGATQMRGDLLAPLERRVAGPGPGAGEMGLHDRPAPGVNAAVEVDEHQLLLRGQWNTGDRRQLVERAGLGSLHARSVIAPDVKDQRVVALADLFERLDDASDLVIGVFLEARIDLHLASVEFLFSLRE